MSTRPTPANTRTRRSARSLAQRPQLIAREQASVASSEDELEDMDADTREVMRRGSGAEYASSEVDVPLPLSAPEPEPQPEPQPAAPLNRETTPFRPRVAPVAAPALATELRAVTYADIDRLWDWSRQDAAGVARFLGKAPEHSKALYDAVELVLSNEELHRTAILRSVYVPAQGNALMHLGFILVAPISRTSTPQVGVVHCYLAPAAQGSLPQLLPHLVNIAGEQEPDLTLMVTTTDYAFARLLQPHGFQLQIALTRPARNAQGGDHGRG